MALYLDSDSGLFAWLLLPGIGARHGRHGVSVAGVKQSMNQSSVIGAALVVAYVIFVVTKGELPCYLSVLGIATATNCPHDLQPAGCAGATTAATTGGGSGATSSGGAVSPPTTHYILNPGGGGNIPGRQIGVGIV